MARESASTHGRKSWTQLIGVATGLLVLSVLAGLPPVTRAISPSMLIAAVIGGAGLFIAVFIGIVRDLGELERRIISEALALTFVVTIAAMFAYPFLEALGLPPLRPQTVAFVLVASFALGITIFSRRYE